MLTVPISTSATNGQPPDPQLSDSGTPAQPTSTPPLASTAPPDSQPNWQDLTYPTDLSQRPSNVQGPPSESAPPPHRIPILEYQWGDELVSQLLVLPPRSNFGGKFAVIADPSVDNAMRAQVFADQLRSQGVPISYATLPFVKHFSHVLRSGGHISHRARRAHSLHIRSSSPASVRTSALAGSSSLSVMTLRILTVCLASGSALLSITHLAEKCLNSHHPPTNLAHMMSCTLCVRR